MQKSACIRSIECRTPLNTVLIHSVFNTSTGLNEIGYLPLPSLLAETSATRRLIDGMKEQARTLPARVRVWEVCGWVG